ncbi:MAG: twin-arginine translocation signal domain-containing protein, partial [Candidatus Omnitrophica bacterium]|nr:twin-arginine translocation signal domain-containing protein [Candidatus Omnitrophota bacterium]
MENQNQLSRRGFIQTTAYGAAATAAFTSAPSVGVTGANDRINIGVIGLGTIAKNHAKKLAEIKDEDNCSIVAICDIWSQRFNEYVDGNPDFPGVKALFGTTPTQYRDYREL